MRASRAEEEGRYLSKRCLKPVGAPLRLQESGSLGLGWGLSVHSRASEGDRAGHNGCLGRGAAQRVSRMSGTWPPGCPEPRELSC